MGVHDLWRLLAPCGHRLSLTTLTRRKLAVDVSIWIQQFLKALPTSQPHLLGLLRRLCKLHYYHIYPVMVFDGPAPNLKKRTLEERRRTRERQRESFERVAERLLLEQLKMKSVKELRRQMARRKKEQLENKVGVEQKEEEKEEEQEMEDDDVIVVGDDTSSPRERGKKAAVKAKKKRGRAAVGGDEHKDDRALMTVIDDLDDDPELLLLRQLQQEEDATASLDLIAQWEGQADENERSAAPALFVAQPLTALTAEERKLGRAYDYISPDEEEDDPLPVHDPLSYQLPANGELDSSVLASLPISLQYSLLEQHRSHHHNMSLRRYAQVKDDTAAFSAMQMGAFLKQVAFNKEIELKRLEMNAREERDGMRVKRLAGDGSREYVYMRKDDKKEQDDKKRQDDEEEARVKEEARQQLAREDSRYLSSHINRVKAQDEAEWRCAECGTRNRDGENDVSGMCHSCGARRTERHPKGGTVGILLGDDEKRANNTKAAVIKRIDSSKLGDKKASTRVTTFHTVAASPSAQPSAAVYWSCKQCSFLNHMQVVKCEICGAKKEDDAHTATLDNEDTQPQPQYAQLTARDDSNEIVHVSDDEMEEMKGMDKRVKEPLHAMQESKMEQQPVAPSVKGSDSVEISFDATGLDDGDDLFPADFFDAFDQQPAPAETLHSLAGHRAPVTAAVSSTEPGASPAKAHLTLGESIKQRRPRMRLKKLDVKEIIWFDEDERHTQHTFDKDADTLVTPTPSHPRPAPPAAKQPRPPAPLPPAAYVEEEKERGEMDEVVTVYDERVVGDNDEVEEIVVRGRVKVVPKLDGDKKQKQTGTEPPKDSVKLTERFLEQDEDGRSEVRVEGKYDSDGEDNKYDSDGEQQQQGGPAVEDDDDMHENEQLRRAIALSMTYAVHRMDSEEEEGVQELPSRHGATDSVPKSKRIAVRALSPHTREKRMLETIAEEEVEMAVELKEQQRDDDTDEVMVVERDTTTTQSPRGAVSQSATISITALQHKAVRAEEEETTNLPKQADSVVSSVQTSAAPLESRPALTAATTEPTLSGTVVSAAPRGFVLPSLASLSTRAAAQPTNLFFAEKQKREQERKEREAAQTAATAAQPPSDQPSLSTLPSTSSPVAPNQSPSNASPATASSPSLSAFPASAPIATWSSASDDPINAAEPSVDAHLSEIYTDSHALSSSLARLKSKQAKQQQQVTTAMLDECRHLLSLFGCPYIIAPAEAEAQCATLEQLGLVDGVVTEDSDVFLFGAKHVYRNIFEQKKYAERYRMDEIAAVLGVDRDGLISLALLLGSDYTCFPRDDHEVLTIDGFKGYSEVEKILRGGGVVWLACPVLRTGAAPGDYSIEYHAVTVDALIEGTCQPGELVRIASANQKSNHVDLLLTKNHRVLVRQSASTMIFNVPWPPSLLPDSTVRDVQSRGGYVSFLPMAARGAVQSIPRRDLDFVITLGLADAEIPAFVELYGFWLGDGSLDATGTIEFEQRKDADEPYLDNLFGQLRSLPMLLDKGRSSSPGLNSGYNYIDDTGWCKRVRRSKEKSDGQKYTWTIYSVSWFTYFASQYGHQYWGPLFRTAVEQAAHRGRYAPPASKYGNAFYDPARNDGKQRAPAVDDVEDDGKQESDEDKRPTKKRRSGRGLGSRSRSSSPRLESHKRPTSPAFYVPAPYQRKRSASLSALPNVTEEENPLLQLSDVDYVPETPPDVVLESPPDESSMLSPPQASASPQRNDGSDDSVSSLSDTLMSISLSRSATPAPASSPTTNPPAAAPADRLHTHHIGYVGGDHCVPLSDESAAPSSTASSTSPLSDSRPPHASNQSPPPAESFKSAKWFWPWVTRLDVELSRYLLRGLRFADGDQINELDAIEGLKRGIKNRKDVRAERRAAKTEKTDAEHKKMKEPADAELAKNMELIERYQREGLFHASATVSTVSPRFRDEVQLVALQAGFSAYWTVKVRAGELVPEGNFIAQRHVRLGLPGVPTYKNSLYEVTYKHSEAKYAYPKLDVNKEFNTVRDGREVPVWCMTAPTDDHLIIVRRTERDENGVRVAPSLPVIVGNSGVHGVGIVNAMEIVNAFPGKGNDGLREFRQWVYSGTVEKRPNVPQLLEAKEGESEAEHAARDKHNAALVAEYRQRLFKFKHRNLRSSWHVSRDFPSDVVRAGYEQPMVDSSEEALSWSKPRWDDIISFLRDKFSDEENERRQHGASLDGQEEEYIAMIKTLRVAYEEEEARAAADPYYQARLDSYFSENDKFAIVASKRINTAILGLTKKKSVEERMKEKEAKRQKKQQRLGVEETDDKENEPVGSPRNAAERANTSPARANNKRGRGARGRGSDRGGDGSRLQSARREAQERRQREDAVWLDDDVVLVDDDEGDDDPDWNAGNASRGRGRGGRARRGGTRSRAG